jgi:hypothetical protein
MRLNASTVRLGHEGSTWSLSPQSGQQPFESSDPDTKRIWWTDVGVHQNMTHGVHPDPISGQHCWHQAVRIRKAEPGDRHGDVVVDTNRATGIYDDWIQKTRSATLVSPNGERRPHWLIRPLKPERDAYKIGSDTAQTRPARAGQP